MSSVSPSAAPATFVAQNATSQQTSRRSELVQRPDIARPDGGYDCEMLTIGRRHAVPDRITFQFPDRTGLASQVYVQQNCARRQHTCREPTLTIRCPIDAQQVAFIFCSYDHRRLAIQGKDMNPVVPIPDDSDPRAIRRKRPCVSAGWLGLEPGDSRTRSMQQPAAQTIEWRDQSTSAEIFYALPLSGRNNELLGILLVGSSRRELVLFTREIESFSMQHLRAFLCSKRRRRISAQQRQASADSLQDGKRFQTLLFVLLS